MTNFFIKSGDTSPALAATLTDSDGNAIDITGASVDFHMSPRGGDGTKVDAQATITDASNGKVEYRWSQSDTDTPGTYRGEFEVTYSGGDVETFPNDEYITISVTEEIA